MRRIVEPYQLVIILVLIIHNCLLGFVGGNSSAYILAGGIPTCAPSSTYSLTCVADKPYTRQRQIGCLCRKKFYDIEGGGVVLDRKQIN